MHLSLREPNRLDATSLPESGRLNRWLEISRAESIVENRGQFNSYRVLVDYQIFNAPRQMTAVTIPQLEFMIIGGSKPIPVFMPEWTFSIGPIAGSATPNDLDLQRDRPPQPIAVLGRGIRLLISTTLLCGMLVYLACRRWLLPRLQRDRYPFSGALRELCRLQRLDVSANSYRLALRAFHAAVNATAGKVVFAGNLNEFLAANAEYESLEQQFSAVYARSRDVFFNDFEVAEPQTSFRELLDLCRRCRTRERSAA